VLDKKEPNFNLWRYKNIEEVSASKLIFYIFMSNIGLTRKSQILTFGDKEKY